MITSPIYQLCPTKLLLLNILLEKKLYGDNITIRYSDSISLLGAKQFIEASESTIEKLNLSSGECTLKQNGHKVSANYVVNNKLADGIIFIPQNRRNFNRFDFSETIEISPNQSKEAFKCQLS